MFHQQINQHSSFLRCLQAHLLIFFSSKTCLQLIWKHPKNNIFLYILESFFIDFGTFLGSWSLPGTPWSLLEHPLETTAQVWNTKEGPRRVPRGSWGGFGMDLRLLGGPLDTRLGKIFNTGGKRGGNDRCFFAPSYNKSRFSKSKPADAHFICKATE